MLAVAIGDYNDVQGVLSKCDNRNRDNLGLPNIGLGFFLAPRPRAESDQNLDLFNR